MNHQNYLGYDIIKIKRVYHVTHRAFAKTNIFPNVKVAKSWIESQNLETIDINGSPTVVCVHPETREPLAQVTKCRLSYQQFTSNCGCVVLFVPENRLYDIAK